MSEQFLATASVRIVPDVTGFAAALQAEVAAATRGVRLGPALAASTTATKTFTAATGVSTLAVKQNAVALEQEGAAAATSAAGTRLSAKAAREAAVAHSQMARGVATATASQFGLRGAVLASSGPFLAAVIAVEAVRKSVDELSAEQEAAARVEKVFGAAGKELEDNAHGLAQGFGLSAAAALKFEGAIGEVFHNVGVANAESAKFSERLVKLSADVGAFNNADPSQVLRAFQLGLSGNLRGLRQFIPGVTAARVALQAMANTGKETKASLTDQELTVARYQVILQAASNQVGTFAERSGNLAGQSKILQSNIANLGAEFGRLAVPILTNVARDANLAFLALGKLKDLVTDLSPATKDAAGNSTFFGDALHYVGDSAKVAAGGLLGIIDAATQEGSSTDAASGRATAFGGVMLGLSDALGQAAQVFTNLANSANEIQFNTAIGQIDALKEHLVQLEIVGATSAQKIGTLGAIAAAGAAAVQSATTVAGRREARQARLQAIQEERSIRAADEAAAKSAASAAASAASKAQSAAEAAARAAQQALDDQDAQLAFEQQRAQGFLAIQAAQAQSTKSLTDDIQNLENQLALTQKQIVDAARIHDTQTRLNTIQQLQLQAVTLQNQIEEQIAEQRQRQRQRKLDALNSAVALASLDAQIAEARGKPNAEINALLRENRALEQSRKAWQGNTQKQKEITLEIARNNAQIKELRKQKDQNKNEFAALEFSFLQTQAGFASTLLSNLLPTASVAGTVGGTAEAISTPTPAGPRPSAAQSLAGAAQVAGGPSGASSGQLSTLIHVQRLMLNAILHLVGQRTHPEAVHQRVTEAVGLDTIR